MPSVLGRTLVVTPSAIGHGDRRRIVHVVASGAIGGGVLHDRRRFTMALGVAIDAFGLGTTGGEAMARQAIGGLAARAPVVRKVALLGVTAVADPRSWVFESLALEVVAIAACDVCAPNVGLVPGARANVGPRDRHQPWRRLEGGARPPVHESRDRKREEERRRGDRAPNTAGDADHGPAPWHSMHGKSWCSSLRLEKPAPCGLPPGPPTR